MAETSPFDSIDPLPPETPDPVPTPGETDSNGTVVNGSGASSSAQSLIYSPRGIVSMAWAQEPFNCLFCVRSDGILIALTYMPDHNVIAWHRHPMNDASVLDVTTVPDPETGNDIVWLLVKRIVQNETVIYHEYLTEFHRPETTTDTTEYCYLDSSLIYSGDPTTTITGLTHLEGKTVDIWADGARHPQKTVVSGSITLDYECSTVCVGIHTPSYIRTLPARISSDQVRVIKNVFLHLYETQGGKVGQTLTNMDDILLRSFADTLDTTPALFTGPAEPITIATTYDYKGQIYIGQDYPAPMTILGVTLRYDGTG